MMDLDPKILLAVGFFLLVLGVVLPFLMVLQILESTLFLNFFSFIAQFLGLIVGFIGAMSLARRSRRRDR
jgi:positive regulator of sigma E activity